MASKKALIIIAVAMILVTASSAYAYKETWDGWFSGGYLTYNSYYYYYSGSGGDVCDSTLSTTDLFYICPGEPVANIPFVCSALDDTIYLTVSYVSGWKYTGQTGTKEAHDGYWSGSGVRRKTQVETIFTSIIGSWDTDDPGDKFDYTTDPDTYSAQWDVTSSSPVGLGGHGTSSGERTR